MECASLKHGIITAILRRDSSNELAAPGSVSGARLMYYCSCSSLDALGSRPRIFYIFGEVHLCSKWGRSWCTGPHCTVTVRIHPVKLRVVLRHHPLICGRAMAVHPDLVESEPGIILHQVPPVKGVPAVQNDDAPFRARILRHLAHVAGNEVLQ